MQTILLAPEVVPAHHSASHFFFSAILPPKTGLQRFVGRPDAELQAAGPS